MGHKVNDIMTKKLLNVFLRFKDRKFFLIRPGGNFGDQLIYRGAEKLAQTEKFSFQSIDHQGFMKENFPSDAVLFINGSGNLSELWSGEPIEELIKSVNEHKGIVILGPSTFMEDLHYFQERIVKSFHGSNQPEHVFIFAREKTSFNLLKNGCPEWIHTEIDHDTAFNLSEDDFLPYRTKGPSYKLCMLRQDKESSFHQQNRGAVVQFDPIITCASLSEWITVHLRATEIITDRLHSSIIGKILGIPTTLLPNIYHKNRSVWEYSLKDAGVAWQDELPQTAFFKFINKYSLLQKLFSSYKVNKLLRTCYKIKADA